MRNFTIKIRGEEAFLTALRRTNSIAWDAVSSKSAIDMFNRGARPPGTPRKEGELIKSRRYTKPNVARGKFSAVFGYVKDYGPHVEYGHRTRNGGYVPGQKYLYYNMRAQWPIFIGDIRKELDNINA